MTYSTNRKLLLLSSLLLLGSFIGVLSVINIYINIMLVITIFLILMTIYQKKYLYYFALCTIPFPFDIPGIHLQISTLILFYLLIVELISLSLKKQSFDKYDILPSVYLFLGLLSILNSESFFTWFKGYLESYMVPILFYFLIRQKLSSNLLKVDNVIFSLITGINILSTIALIEFFIFGGTINFVGDANYKLSGTILSQGNGIAMNIEMILPYMVIALFFKGQKKSFYNIISLIFNSTILFLSLSRGAWISVLVFTLILQIYRKKYLRIFILLIMVGITITFIKPIRTRLFTDLSTLFFRSDLWAVSIEIFKNNLLFGIPYNEFHGYYELFFNTVVALSRTHNIFLDFLIFNGITGGIFLILLFKFVFKKFNYYIRIPYLDRNQYELIFYFVFLVTFTHGLIDSTLFSYSRDIYFWISFSIFIMSIKTNIYRGNNEQVN
ncbi:O-antigen ligase family protein [Neobacillus niacini]|uniref:O-antigen ligase family protein n=1 Tax=Neobacillus niacini TaxID=86668 RepID=UPI003B020398